MLSRVIQKFCAFDTSTTGAVVGVGVDFGRLGPHHGGSGGPDRAAEALLAPVEPQALEGLVGPVLRRELRGLINPFGGPPGQGGVAQGHRQAHVAVQ